MAAPTPNHIKIPGSQLICLSGLAHLPIPCGGTTPVITQTTRPTVGTIWPRLADYGSVFVIPG